MRWTTSLTLVVLMLGCSSKTPNSTPAPASNPTNSSTSTPTNKSSETASPADSQTAGQTAPAAQATASPESDVVVKTVAEISKSMRTTLGEQYPTQTIEVTGPVDSVGYSLKDITGLALKHGPGTFDIAGFPLQEAEAWARISPGQTVTVRAKYNKDSLDGFLWKIYKAGPNPSPILTTTQLGEDFKKDLTAAHNKYTGRSFYLTGKVASAETNDLKLTKVKLDTGSLPSPLLVVEPHFVDLAPITAGQTLNALCIYNRAKLSPPLNSDETLIDIDNVELITIKFPVDGVTYAKELSPAK
ncbi:hypothetical protein [Schlesneria paludicola]|uniref:hypothetical protein n=1 Tax=Schlesneria paludicola TaxID=360056 RepID=UPI0012FC3EC7|nr:hypothetical protein [Schlesneria paludicola]